jgi:hypothetical protein
MKKNQCKITNKTTGGKKPQLFWQKVLTWAFPLSVVEKRTKTPLKKKYLPHSVESVRAKPTYGGVK